MVSNLLLPQNCYTSREHLSDSKCKGDYPEMQ